MRIGRWRLQPSKNRGTREMNFYLSMHNENPQHESARQMTVAEDSAVKPEAYCKNLGRCRRKGYGCRNYADDGPQCYKLNGKWHRFNEWPLAMDEAVAMDDCSNFLNYQFDQKDSNTGKPKSIPPEQQPTPKKLKDAISKRTDSPAMRYMSIINR